MKKYTIIIALFVMFFASINTSFAKQVAVSNDNSNNEEVKQLKLNGVKIIGKNLVELEFDSNIDKESDKDISVRNNGENSDENYVKDYKVNENIVELVLENDLESEKSYEIIIYSIMGEDGSTITSGLDGALEFSTGDLSIYDEKEEEVKEENIEEVEMTSAGVEEKTQTGEVEKNENLAGKDIKDEELKNNIEVVALQKDELAKTGPEHVLLAILALILAALVGYTLNQRKNNKI